MSVGGVNGNGTALKRRFSKSDKDAWRRSAADFVIAAGGTASTTQIMENHGGSMSDMSLVTIVVRGNPWLVKTGQRIAGTAMHIWRVSPVYEPKKSNAVGDTQADKVEGAVVERSDPVFEHPNGNGKLKSEQSLDLVASRLTHVTKSLLDDGHYDEDRREQGSLVIKLKIGELDFSCEGSSAAVERQLNRVLDTLVESGFFAEIVRTSTWKNVGDEV